MPDFVPPPQNKNSPFADMRGHHVAVRVPSLQDAKDFYVEKLDFRIIAEWDFGDEKLAYLAAPAQDDFYFEVLGGGDTPPSDVRPYTTLADSLNHGGYHHFCVQVDSVDATLERLRERGVKIIEEPFVVAAVSRRLAFFADPFGNLIELSEVVD